MSDTVSVRKGDLGVLVAAITTWAPADTPQEVAEAFSRMLTAFDEAHAGDDAPGSEPAKVIVVADSMGRQRRYEANQWQDDEEALDVYRRGELIATYPKGHWTRAFAEGTELDGITPKARRLQSALRQIAMAEMEETEDVKILQRIARAELERSGWDEEDL